MPNLVGARAACASFAVACVLALLAACGSEPEYPDEPIEVHYPAYGPTSPEELVYYSTVVARVRLLSASAGVRTYRPEYDRSPAPVFAFRFRVAEYIKGSGDDELTVRVIAASLDNYVSDANAARARTPAQARIAAQARLAERDTRWDDREAIVFLRPSPVSAEAGDYEFAYRSDWSPRLYSYDIASGQNRAWLPAVAAPDSSPSSEPRYLTAAPGAAPSETPISLSEMKALVAANADMVAKGKNIPGYKDCIEAKFEFDALYKIYPPQMDFYESRIPSGQPAGHRIWEGSPRIRTSENHYARWWLAGPDSDLFTSMITHDPDNNPATGYAWEHVTRRPIPEGEYNVFLNDQPSRWAPCGYNPEASLNRRDRTIIATAPDGVIHESFFDPVNMTGGAIGADDANGVLKPTEFTFNSASVSIDSIRWQAQAVETRLSPHTRLANHRADFIAEDGSVALRLDFDDAAETGAGASRALSWKVCAQPWSDGDLLMLRVSESPTDLTGATLDADC